MAIGAVLDELAPDFPDVSISKIRFLEAEGLVTPERTGSGYRTFSSEDLERLRYILTAQRDRFWPLKVIREALDKLDRGLEPAPGDVAPSRPQVPAGTTDPRLPAAAELSRRDVLRLTDVELREATGLDQPTFEALSTYGLLRPDSGGHYGDAALAVARARPVPWRHTASNPATCARSARPRTERSVWSSRWLHRSGVEAGGVAARSRMTRLRRSWRSASRCTRLW